MTKEDYFVELIVSKCLSFDKTSSLLISYNNFNEAFVQKILDKLDKNKVNDIYLDCIDPFYEHDMLKAMTLEEIAQSDYFKASIYNDYAQKKANFLILVSPVPNIMDDIESDKLALVSKIKNDSRKKFSEGQSAYKFPWSIVPVYNEYWEKELKISNLEEILYDICMIDKDYSKNWDNFIGKNIKLCSKLNELKLDYLIYSNEEGSNLKVGLNPDYEFTCIGMNEVFVNFPSYEVFTSPDRTKTEGKVYSTKPLLYNGSIIDEFYLEFKDGKVVNYDAKKGKDLLTKIVEFDENSAYLGEVALVENDSPISKTNLVFKTTLLDENASCHLALGRGFGKGSKKKLIKQNINQSGIHVDFMIGSKSLNIVGIKDGKEIPIMKNGKYVL